MEVTRGTVSDAARHDLNEALAYLNGFEIEVSDEIPDPNTTRLFQDYVVQELLKVLRHKTQFLCFGGTIQNNSPAATVGGGTTLIVPGGPGVLGVPNANVHGGYSTIVDLPKMDSALFNREEDVAAALFQQADDQFDRLTTDSTLICLTSAFTAAAVSELFCLHSVYEGEIGWFSGALTIFLATFALLVFYSEMQTAAGATHFYWFGFVGVWSYIRFAEGTWSRMIFAANCQVKRLWLGATFVVMTVFPLAYFAYQDDKYRGMGLAGGLMSAFLVYLLFIFKSGIVERPQGDQDAELNQQTTFLRERLGAYLAQNLREAAEEFPKKVVTLLLVTDIIIFLGSAALVEKVGGKLPNREITVSATAVAWFFTSVQAIVNIHRCNELSAAGTGSTVPAIRPLHGLVAVGISMISLVVVTAVVWSEKLPDNASIWGITFAVNFGFIAIKLYLLHKGNFPMTWFTCCCSK
ncbi:hypothetical protein CAOG_003527 [Capsaspora owczarzaki ATCC 30864]|uniref:Uncharacterized protein n=1 Tax=Capsaspora owczarzaki (strain ATCC 30864) TaxID=595528 RepID=A0A0D2X2I1_CAPO3|nr:hypothetical protein CAOG_003527 [Capsaspora owczarzaki ATCC 30864]